MTSAELAALPDQLAALSTRVDDPERVDRIRALEHLKAAAAAAQARMTAAFVASQHAEQTAAGVRASRIGQGVATQVGLARRESPARAARYTGWAQLLVRELPATFAALERGETTEWRAMVVARETVWLTREHRAVVDGSLAGRLGDLGDRQVEAETRRLAYRLDPNGFLARSRAAERDRRVTLRPAPDTMTRLTALLPAAQGVAAYAALRVAADSVRAAGDERSRGQVMADTLVQRVTGQATADGVPVEINLVLTDETLLHRDTATGPQGAERNVDDRDASSDTGKAADGGPTGHGEATDHNEATANDDPAAHGATPDHGKRADLDPAAHGEPGAHAAAVAGERGADEPGILLGYGPVPAGLARDLARSAAVCWLRRLYRHPTSGQLVALDARRRVFDGQLRQAIILRDQLCRTPWCNAPIRHADHARPVAEGGETSYPNGQGLCEACNYAKQAPGWSTAPGPGGTGREVITTTPTGHAYTSRPPDLPGQRAGPAPPAAHRRAA